MITSGIQISETKTKHNESILINIMTRDTYIDSNPKSYPINSESGSMTKSSNMNMSIMLTPDNCRQTRRQQLGIIQQTGIFNMEQKHVFLINFSSMDSYPAHRAALSRRLVPKARQRQNGGLTRQSCSRCQTSHDCRCWCQDGVVHVLVGRHACRCGRRWTVSNVHVACSRAWDGWNLLSSAGTLQESTATLVSFTTQAEHIC